MEKYLNSAGGVLENPKNLSSDSLFTTFLLINLLEEF